MSKLNDIPELDDAGADSFQLPDDPEERFSVIYAILFRRLAIPLRKKILPACYGSLRWAIDQIHGDGLTVDEKLRSRWTDFEELSGPHMLRLANIFEAKGVDPTIRNLLEAKELWLVELFANPQIGKDARDTCSSVREDDSYWMRLYNQWVGSHVQ